MDLKKLYTFNFPTKILFGAGVIKKLGSYLKENNLRSPLIVTDPGLQELPLINNIQGLLESSDQKVSIFSKIEKNPIKQNVHEGKEFYLNNNCDCVIGIGGGASMDVARSIALMINHSGDLFDYEESVGGDTLVKNEIPYFITVPTTSGTGSEVGRSSVISDDFTHEKKIIFHSSLMAKAVFADPELTLSLPPFVTAATGADALTHNIEAYLVETIHPLCDGIALEAISLIGESLVNSVNNPTLEDRAKMMLGAMMGAIAFQKGLGVIHSMAHSLSTNLNLHHGLANALALSIGVEFNADVSEKKLITIADKLKIEDKSSSGLVNYLINLNKEIGIKSPLKELNLNDSDINNLVNVAYKDVCHQSNPKTVTREDFENLFKKLLC